MKLAFLLTRLQDKNFFGGGEIISFNLLKHLSKACTVDVYCGETNVSADYGINRLVVGDLEENVKKVAEMFKDGHYDHVISENHFNPIDITLAHGHSVLYRQKTARNFVERLVGRVFSPGKTAFTKIQRDSFDKNNLIIVPSEVCKHDYTAFLKIDEKKVKVIYPGVNISETEVQHDEEKPNNTTFTFGLSAPGFANKGGYLFLFAAFLLKSTGMEFRARVIYSGHKKNKLVKFLVSVLGLGKTVEFLDFQPDMNTFYGLIDCLVVPSNLETFGMVILEAMAAKTPVVVSSRCGACELIENEKNGIVFEYGAFRLFSLVNGMLYVLKNREKIKKIADNGFETALKYNWGRYCEEFLKVCTR